MPAMRGVQMARVQVAIKASTRKAKETGHAQAVIVGNILQKRGQHHLLYVCRVARGSIQNSWEPGQMIHAYHVNLESTLKAMAMLPRLIALLAALASTRLLQLLFQVLHAWTVRPESTRLFKVPHPTPNA